MKQIIGIFAALTLFCAGLPAADALSLPSASPITDTSQVENRTLLHTIADLQDQKQLLLSKEIELRQLEERGPPANDLVERLEAELQLLQAEITNLKQDPNASQELIASHETERLKKETELQAAKTDYDKASSEYVATLALLKEEIVAAQAETAKLSELAETQGFAFVTRFAIFFLLVLCLFIAQAIISKMIRRVSGRIPVQRATALLRLNKIVFNVLIVITILAGIFSQLISFLPFLAILGTALAFALRDIVSSFIAWFIIGTEQGYRIGDLIQTGKLRGRVLEIHPFLTVIRQTGLRGDTGRIVSFPNKYIFEQEVQNFSKLYRFIYIMLDFILDRNSDIEAAKNALLETMLECLKKDLEEAEKKLPGLQSKFSLSPRQIQPQIFIEPDPRGILLRGKYFVRLENRHKSRSEITEHFLQKLQKLDNVDLRFVEFGEESKEAIPANSFNF